VLDLRPGQAQRASLLRALLIGGLAGLALAALAGSWLGRRAVRPLETALMMQRRFVADASHELRTPLTLLSTRTQLLRRRLRSTVDATALRTQVDGVVAEADRLTAILDDLLLAADPRADPPDEPVDLTALADEVVAAAGAAAESAHVTISAVRPAAGSTRAGHDRVHVIGSAVGLRRALVALTDNAIRHARHNVTVAVDATPRAVVVEVVDDGPGIDGEVLPHVFHRFASSTGGSPGRRHYGLGLALVSDVVNRHGGNRRLAPLRR
jgi:signal transduction histidine kinase